MVFYGVVECVNAFKIMNIHRQVARIEAQQQAEAETVEAEAVEVSAQDNAETSCSTDEPLVNNTPEEQDNPNLGAGI